MLLTAFVIAFGTGCSKSDSGLLPAPTNSAALSPDTTVRVHWLGKRGMELRMGSYYLMRIWQLQVSDSLQARTLSRLASAPSRWLAIPPERAELANGLLGSSLKDVVLDECYLEVRQPTNQTAELTFAIHLDPERAASWETNLANIVGLLTGAFPTPASNGLHGWSLHRTQPPNLLQFQRVNDWAVFGAGTGSNALFSEIRDRVRRYDDPFAANASTNWLEADLDLPRLAVLSPQFLSRVTRHPSPSDFPLSARAAGGEGQTPRLRERERVAEGRVRVNGKTPFNEDEVGLKNISALNFQLSTLNHLDLTVTGDGANVLTHGELIFSGPLQIECKPWMVPINLIPEPLNSFTAVRGLGPWLSSLKIWNDLPFGAPPDQIYFWAPPGTASQAYFAAPLLDASNQVNRLAEYLMEKTNPWLATNGYVKFERLPESNGVSWGNMPSIRPFFKFVDTANGGVVFGGLLPNTTPGTNTQDNLYTRPSRSRLFDEISAQTNLVYFDWELTATRIDPCLYLGQVARVVSRHAQLPLESASLKWLRAIQPGLGGSTTIITCAGTNQLSFFRKSTVGFTGVELQLLADWLESPQFPNGLYSLLTPPPAQP